MKLQIIGEIICTCGLCFVDDHMTGTCAVDVGRFKCPQTGLEYICGKERQKIKGNSRNKKGTKQEYTNENIIMRSVTGGLLLAVIYRVKKFINHVECGGEQWG